MNPIRRAGLTVILIAILVLPAWSAEHFTLRIYGGGNYLSGGDLNRGLQGWADYWSAFRTNQGYTQQTGAFQPVHFGLNAGGDLMFHLNPHLALGIGTELVSASKTTTFDYRSSSASIDWEYSGKPSAVPIKLSVFYSLPLGDRLKARFHAGAGYYFAKAKIDSRTESNTNADYLIDSKAQGVGYHGGMALEIKILEGLNVFLEAAGRILTLSGFEGSVTMGGGAPAWEGTLRYWEASSTSISRYGYLDLTIAPPSGKAIFFVRDAKIDFSGASLRLGLAITL